MVNSSTNTGAIEAVCLIAGYKDEIASKQKPGPSAGLFRAHKPTIPIDDRPPLPYDASIEKRTEVLMMIQVDADKVLAAIREFQREKQYTPAPSDIADMLRLPLPAVLVAIDTLIDRGIFKRGSWLVIQGPSPAPVVLASTERKPRRQSASPTEPTAHFDVFDACLPELSPECRERSRQRFLALREQYPYYDIGSFLSRERVAHGLPPDFPLADAG